MNRGTIQQRTTTRIPVLQRGKTLRKSFKDKKYYQTILETGKCIYKKGVLVRCIDRNNTQYKKYGHICSVLNIGYITEDTYEEYIVHFIGSDYGL